MPRINPIKLLPSGAVAVDQGTVNGWRLSYNPDDRRFYVARPVREGELEFMADFKELRNARAWAMRTPHP